MDRVQWNRTMHLSDMTDGTGNVGRQLFPGQLLVPDHVAVEGDRLVWYADVEPPSPPFVRADAALLDHFVRLSDGAPSAVLRFARRWGPIRLKEHDTENGKHTLSGAEPLDLWRSLAKQVATLLHSAARLYQKERVPMEDWRVALTTGVLPEWAAPALEALEQLTRPGTVEMISPATVVAIDRITQAMPVGSRLAIPVETERRVHRGGSPNSDTSWLVLKEIVNAWLDYGVVKPRLSLRSGGAPEIELAGHGLVGALAVQLLAAVSRSEGVALCSSCGVPYPPNRRPRVDQRHYCPQCRKPAAWRDSKRDLRQRKKQAPDRL